MKFDFLTVNEVVKAAKQEKLYQDILVQLQKDFNLANVSIEIFETTDSDSLRTIIREKIYFLILEKFDVYLNLIYIIDVPQKEFKNIHVTDAVDVADQMTLLILRREFKKVWYKKKYSS